MKNFFKIFGIVAIVVIIGFSITACGGGGGGNDPDTVTYTGAKDGTTYTLKITQTGARYTAQVGDAYELTAGAKKSTGKVADVSSSVLTLTSNTNTTFKANISSGKLTGFTGSVKWDGESTESSLPTDLTTGGGGDPVTPPVSGTFNTIADFRTWYKKQNNTPEDKPYYVKLNVSDLGGSSSTEGSIGYTISDGYFKYVILDFSGSSFTTIPDGAFSNCDKLTGIIIPNSVTSIGDGAFNACSGLTSITIPNSVTSIGSGAFANSSLKSITIPDSVTSIGEYEFGGGCFGSCLSLTSVTIGNGMTSIASKMFINCWNLTSVTIGNNVTSISGSAFNNCTSLTSITIPNSVTSIDSAAFQRCTSLTSITIPNSVTSISYYAFDGCTSLTSVTFQGMISSEDLDSSHSFLGDLRVKYLAGGIGTYTTTAPVDYFSKWTKQ